MSAPVFVPLPGNEEMARALARRLGGEVFVPQMRAFPDGETYFRLAQDVRGRSLTLVATLDRPDAKLVPLLFAAATARDLGAKRIGLVAPYLAYMRQDKRFHPGEAEAAKTFASLLSPHFDWLATVDPHLHRLHALSEIYTLDSRVVHAAPVIADWIRREVRDPVLIGPDAESGQWVEAVAKDAGAAYIVLDKIRRGDRDVSVAPQDMTAWRRLTPVLVDDIISSGRTMIEALKDLREAKMKPAVCIAIHAVFAAGAYEDLVAAGPARIVTANTIAHPTNAIDVSGLVAATMQELA